MRKLFILGCAALLVGGSAVASAQHEGHQMPGQPQVGVEASAETVRACAQALQEIAVAADRINARLEAARQTNSPPAMRSAMDDLQAALVEIRMRAAACTGLQPAVPKAGEHAGDMMGGTPQTAPTSSGAPVVQAVNAPDPAEPAQPTEAIDPVCSMRVDPRTAPKATYKGKTYYFCSQADHDLFVKAPEKYVK